MLQNSPNNGPVLITRWKLRQSTVDDWGLHLPIEKHSMTLHLSMSLLITMNIYESIEKILPVLLPVENRPVQLIYLSALLEICFRALATACAVAGTSRLDIAVEPWITWLHPARCSVGQILLRVAGSSWWLRFWIFIFLIVHAAIAAEKWFIQSLFHRYTPVG